MEVRMAKAKECLIDVNLALQLREFLEKHGRKFKKGELVCKECRRPVKPMVKSPAGAAHFEHFNRNLDCRLSDKRTARRLYAEHKANK
jgi:hypothetical protein